MAFHNALELIQSDQIDMVTIAVKVPHHFELVSAALYPANCVSFRRRRLRAAKALSRVEGPVLAGGIGQRVGT